MRSLIAILSLGFLIASCASVAGAQGLQAEANKQVIRRAFRGFEEGDVAVLNELFDPKGPWHAPSGKTILQGGPFSDLQGSCPMCAALKQRKITVDVMLAEGDLVAVRSTWSGRYTGDYKRMAVIDKEVSLVYTNIYRVVDGRIRENWADADRLSLAERLGMKLAPAENSK